MPEPRGGSTTGLPITAPLSTSRLAKQKVKEKEVAGEKAASSSAMDLKVQLPLTTAAKSLDTNVIDMHA